MFLNVIDQQCYIYTKVTLELSKQEKLKHLVWNLK